MNRGRAAVRDAGVFALYLALAIVLTWPLAANLRTTVSDLGDPLLNAWILDWDCTALTHHPLHLFQAPIFYPSKYPLAYSENLLGIAIVCLPFHWAGASPLAVYNIALLLGFAFSAYGAFVLGRVITGRTMPSFIAGLLFGFVPYGFDHLAHLQILWSGWLPLMLAALLVYQRAASWRNAALLGGAFLMNGLTNIYFLLFGSVAVALTLLLFGIAESRDRAFWGRIALALAIACVALLPILIPYQIVSSMYGMRRGGGESLGASATMRDWLVATSRSALYGLIPTERFGERNLFPGLLPIFLLVVAWGQSCGRRFFLPVVEKTADRSFDPILLILAVLTWIGAVTDGIRLTYHGRLLLDFGTATIPAMLLAAWIVFRCRGWLRTTISQSRFPIELWTAGLWIVIGIAGSLGMHLFFHAFLFHAILPFRAIRVPARWAMIAYTGLVGWTAVGAASLDRRRWAGPLLIVLALINVWPVIRWEHALADPEPADRWIAANQAGPLIELPINRLNVLYLYLLRATTHHVPIFDGISGFEPPLHRALRDGNLDDRTFDVLEQNGCRFILVRPEWFGWQFPQAVAWLRGGLATGRLTFLRRFDGGVTGDWLFALPRVERSWQRYRQPQIPDGAGFTPDEELARLLDFRSTYSGSTFGQLYQPKSWADVAGPLTVSGWALSPDGIREVNALLENGRVRVPMGLFAREDVTRLHPWYPRTPRPAFSATIARRPKGVRRETDLQIEIVDGGGRRTLLPDVLITWR